LDLFPRCKSRENIYLNVGQPVCHWVVCRQSDLNSPHRHAKRADNTRVRGV